LSDPGGEDQPVLVAGFFLDKDQVPLKALLQRLLPTTYSKAIPSFSPVHDVGAPERRRVFQHPEYQPGPPPGRTGMTELWDSVALLGSETFAKR
jgi:hypothetical protein